MTSTLKKIDPRLLESGVNEYNASLTDDNRRIRDPIITPFGMAMKIDGYRHVSRRPGGCDILRECPHCKSKYSTLLEKSGDHVWACPHCKTIEAARVGQDRSLGFLQTIGGTSSN